MSHNLNICCLLSVTTAKGLYSNQTLTIFMYIHFCALCWLCLNVSCVLISLLSRLCLDCAYSTLFHRSTTIILGRGLLACLWLPSAQSLIIRFIDVFHSTFTSRNTYHHISVLLQPGHRSGTPCQLNC